MSEIMVGVGMPAWIKLNHFGREIFYAFGDVAFLTGSAAKGKAWRDVDVRLILDYDKFFKLFPPTHSWFTPQLDAVTMAFAALGREMTGLPIDFQIQNDVETLGYNGEPRVPLIDSIPDQSEARASVAALSKENGNDE